MKKFLLFDNDGILVNTERYYFQSSREILASVGCDLTKELFIELSLTRGVGVWDGFPELEEGQVNTLREKRDILYNEMLQHEPIAIDGVEGVLKELQGTYRMAIITSALKKDFLTIHKRTGFLDYFEFFVANGDYTHSKPSPEPYLAGLHKFGAKSEEAVVIEDTHRGIRAGLAAGITTVAIPNEMNKTFDFSEADFRLETISELPRLLHSL